jgi:hypothetical protein
MSVGMAQSSEGGGTYLGEGSAVDFEVVAEGLCVYYLLDCYGSEMFLRVVLYSCKLPSPWSLECPAYPSIAGSCLAALAWDETTPTTSAIGGRRIVIVIVIT